MTPKIREVRINTLAESYLERRNLTKQYLKACEYIVDGNIKKQISNSENQNLMKSGIFALTSNIEPSINLYEIYFML